MESIEKLIFDLMIAALLVGPIGCSNSGWIGSIIAAYVWQQKCFGKIDRFFFFSFSLVKLNAYSIRKRNWVKYIIVVAKYEVRIDQFYSLTHDKCFLGHFQCTNKCISFTRNLNVSPLFEFGINCWQTGMNSIFYID